MNDSENSLTQLAGCLIIEDRKLLLLYRVDEDHWEVPGGKVEEDESPTEAAVREAKEEIGVKVSLEKPFYSGEFQHNGKLFLWHGYLSEIQKGSPEIQDGDCSCGESACSSNHRECCKENFSEKKWFTRTDLEEKDLAPNLKQVQPALRKILREEEG